MEKDYLYRWNFEEGKMEMFVGHVEDDYDYMSDRLFVWFEPDGSMSYHDNIDLECNGDYDMHVYGNQLLLPERDDEKALEIFKREFRYDMEDAKKTFEKLEKALTAMERMGT